MSPPDLHIEILTPNVMELGGGTLGGEALLNGIHALIKGTLETSLVLLSSREDTEKVAICNLEEIPHQNSARLVP